VRARKKQYSLLLEPCKRILPELQMGEKSKEMGFKHNEQNANTGMQVA